MAAWPCRRFAAAGLRGERGGAEYPLQDGFGWTNGVTAAMLDLYGQANAAASCTRKENDAS